MKIKEAVIGRIVQGAFSNHQKSQAHRKAVSLMVTLPATAGNIGEMLSSGADPEF